MQVIPLAAQDSQTVAVTLAGQSCQINVYQKTWYSSAADEGAYTSNYLLFLDLYLNSALLIGGVICLNGVRIVRDAYFGFVGDLIFLDTQGSEDPVASGLGTRFQLVYLETSDLAEASV